MWGPTAAGYSVAYFSLAAWSSQASACDSAANFEVFANSTFTSASGRCSLLSVPSSRGMP